MTSVAWITTKAGSGVRSQSRIVADHLDVQLVASQPTNTDHATPHLTDDHGVVHPTTSLADALLDLAPDVIVFHALNPYARDALRRVHPYAATAVRLGVNLHAEVLAGKQSQVPDLLDMLHLSDHVIASGSHPEAIVRAIGFDDSRVSVIPSMIDAERVRPAPEHIPNTVGVLGRVDAMKHQFLAVEAANAVKTIAWDDTPDVVLAGQENDATLGLLGSVQSQLGYPGEIHYLGHVPDPMQQFWPRVGVHLQPSYTENCPQTVLEAAKMGVPTIAASGAVWARDFEKLLRAPIDDPVKWGSQIHDLLSDDGLRRKVVAVQQGMLEGFDVGTVVPQYRALFEELADGVVPAKIPPEVVA